MTSRIFTFSLGLVLAGACLAQADEIISPPQGKTWGEENSAQSILNMNRDPETVKQADPDRTPIPIRGTCTDTDGQTYTGDDVEYSVCMNHKKKKPEPASAPPVKSKHD